MDNPKVEFVEFLKMILSEDEIENVEPFRFWYDDIMPKEDGHEDTKLQSAILEFGTPTQIRLKDGMGSIIDSLMEDLFDADLIHLGQTDKHLILVYGSSGEELPIDKLGVFLTILSWKVGDLQLKLGGDTYAIKNGEFHWNTKNCNGDSDAVSTLDVTINDGKFPLEVYNKYLSEQNGYIYLGENGKIQIEINLKDSGDYSGVYRFLEYLINNMVNYNIDCHIVHGIKRYLVY